jgi:nitroreductase
MVQTGQSRRLQVGTDTDDPRAVAACLPDGSLPVRARARWALNVAQLAPSVHNSQPWAWRLDAAADTETVLLHLRMDAARHLPALDPRGREQVISCGAALRALHVGLEAAGLSAMTALVPVQLPGVLASVTVTSGRAEPSGAAGQRLGALRRRRSERGWFCADPLPVALAESLVRNAAAHRVTARILTTDSERDVVERLLAMATLDQVERGEVPAEVRRWTRDEGDHRRDGVPAASWGRSSVETVTGAVILRDFALGRAVPKQAEAPDAEPPPALVMLSTRPDDREAQVRTGMALVDVLIAVELAGYAAGHVNQATEVDAIRVRLGHELGVPGWPQLMLRIGRRSSAASPLTPRRPLASVLDTGPHPPA